MRKPNSSSAELSLTIAYDVAADALPRWKIRRWVQRAMLAAQRAQTTTFTRFQVGLRVVGRHEAQQLNNDYRHKNYATNVLTFEYGVQPDGTASGDIVLCLPVLQSEACAQHKKFEHHAAHLVVHGTLHALGYDHETPSDATQMEQLEVDILVTMGINNPYLIIEK